jgi:DNA topoisomerase 2-associated protein PAT1
MSGFFGFDSALPERRDAPFQDFTNPIDGAGAEEDLAVYTWGEEGYDGLGNALLEGGDDLNDETFGDDMGPVGMLRSMTKRG